jgi:hypothetical protein
MDMDGVFDLIKRKKGVILKNELLNPDGNKLLCVWLKCVVHSCVV